MIMNEVSGLQNILMFNSLMFFARRDKKICRVLLLCGDCK